MNLTNSSKDMHGDQTGYFIGFIVFWLVTIVGFVFSLITTLCLFLTKEIRRAEVYITVSSMTFSELLVYLLFLILLGINIIPVSITVSHVCLMLNTLVGFFKTYSLSLAIFLCLERIVAVSCPRVYRVAKRKRSRLIVQAVILAADFGFYTFLNYRYGDTNASGKCSTAEVYGDLTHFTMTVLRIYTIVKMGLILFLAAVAIYLLRMKMKIVAALKNEGQDPKGNGE